MLSRLAAVEHEADALFERYEPTLAVRAVMQFIDDDVSNWYVRLTRNRRYDVESADSRAAFATLHEVLVVSSRLLAPVAPFMTDWLHRELTGGSVHLASYVRPGSEAAIDQPLERAMGAIRTLATLARSVRAAAKIKTRQPLSRLVCRCANDGRYRARCGASRGVGAVASDGTQRQGGQLGIVGGRPGDTVRQGELPDPRQEVRHADAARGPGDRAPGQ